MTLYLVVDSIKAMEALHRHRQARPGGTQGPIARPEAVIFLRPVIYLLIDAESKKDCNSH
ncbi:protein of unknown function [Cupriavidus taiwanensis]|nr:protein of unknown function [Cupriavidus taiwanensis]